MDLLCAETRELVSIALGPFAPSAEKTLAREVIRLAVESFRLRGAI